MTYPKAEVGDRVRIKVGAQTGKTGEIIRLVRHSRRGSVWYQGRLVARTLSTITYQVRIPDGAMRAYYSFRSSHFNVIKRAR